MDDRTEVHETQNQEELESIKAHQPATEQFLQEQRIATQKAYNSLTEEQRQSQASFWAQNFLIAELATANRLLRTLLINKEVITQEDDEIMSQTMGNKNILRQMYDNTERAFYDKYQRVRFAMENPAEVTRLVEEQEKGEEQPKEGGDAQ